MLLSPTARSRARRFLSYYRPYRAVLAIDLVCALAVAAVALLLPLCAGDITRAALDPEAPDALDRVARTGALMLGLIALHTVCNTYVDHHGHMMGTRMERDMRRDLFAHLQRLPFAFHDRRRTGELVSRLTNDLFAIGELCHHGPEDLAIALLKGVGVFVVLFRLDAGLTLVVFAFLPPMAAYALHFNRRLNDAYRRSHERVAEVNARAEDALAGTRVVQALANEAAEDARFAAEQERFVEARRDAYRHEAVYHQGMTAFGQLMTLAVVAGGGVAIARASLTADELVTFVLCVGLLLDPIARFVNFSRLCQEGLTGFDRFAELMETEPDLREAPHAVDPGAVRGEIEFRRVGFRYARGGEAVLRGLDLRVRAGEFVALVGPSGAGKTTLGSLVPRFYDATEGSVLLDGRDVRDLRLAALRRNVGVVQQDVYLFAGSVLDNIRSGRPDATRAEVEEAARLAGAHDFVAALPRGYDTDVGQRGVRLSGGQKQRLSLARVFLKDPPVLIFDEATSALDTESERVVQAALERLAARRTTLVIAHRLSTVRRADRIVVLDGGRVAEEGTHEELLARGGLYARLHDARDGL